MKTYTVKESAKILRCSNVKLYELIRQNKIQPVAKIGKKIIIPELSLNAFLLNVKLDCYEELLKLSNQ